MLVVGCLLFGKDESKQKFRRKKEKKKKGTRSLTYFDGMADDDDDHRDVARSKVK